MHTLDCIGGVYEVCTVRTYISVGYRDGGPGTRGTAHSSALGEERVGVIDCRPSLGNYNIPDTVQVPGTPEYFFCHRGIHCQEYVNVVGTRYCIGGLHMPYVDHC